MLIKVFGIWLMANNITYLEDTNNNKCLIKYGYTTYLIFNQHSCDEVAAEINKQLSKD